jgi:hypothetical protein
MSDSKKSTSDIEKKIRPILERLTYHLMKDRPKNVVKYIKNN